MAKMTLKDAAARAYNFPKDKELAVLQTIDYPLDYNDIVYYPHKKDGKNIFECYCPECGARWTADRPPDNMYELSKCPKCGEEKYFRMFNGYSLIKHQTGKQAVYLAVMEIDPEAGFILFEKCRPVYSYETKKPSSYALVRKYADNEDYSFIEGSWKLDLRETEKIIFLKDKGFRSIFENGEGVVSAKNSYNYFKRWYNGDVLLDNNLDELLSFASDLTKETCTRDNVMEILADYSYDITRSATERKPVHRISKLEKKLLEYEPEQVSESEFDMAQKNCGHGPSVVKDSFGTKNRLIIYCMSCGKMFQAMKSLDSYYYVSDTCPNCGKSVTYSTVGDEAQTFPCIRFEVMPETGYLVQRKFNVTVRIKGTKAVRKTEESERIFYTEKSPVRFVKSSDGWIKGSCKSGSTSFTAPMQDDGVIRNCIEKSILKYSGLVEAWGLNSQMNGKVEEIGSNGGSSYAYAWYKKPYIEKTAKTGLWNITKDFVNDSEYPADAAASSVLKLLDITKPVYDMAREMDLNMQNLRLLKRMYALDQTITADEYGEMLKYAYPADYETLNNAYGIKPKKAMEYLQSCYDEQCIEKTDAMRTWMDYLRMADDIGYDLKDKRNKFPDSLRKEHDRATFAYSRIKDDISRKRFAKQYEINKKYEYSKGNFIVKIPETSEEIVAEATNQRNCVASYVTRVCNGETVVAFVRKKAEPDTSYVTMEIYKDRIYQLKGFANSKVKDIDTLEFVRDFAVNKNLGTSF